MKKVAIALLALSCITFGVVGSAQAEGISNIGLGLDLALPMGDFGDAADAGFGATFSAQMDLDQNISFTARTGYIYFGGKDFSILGQTISNTYGLIPIHAGARYYLTPAGQSSRFFVGGELGLDILSVKTEATIAGITVDDSNSDSEVAFVPLAGVQFADFEIMGVISLGDADYFGARIAYLIPMGDN